MAYDTGHAGGSGSGSGSGEGTSWGTAVVDASRAFWPFVRMVACADDRFGDALVAGVTTTPEYAVLAEATAQGCALELAAAVVHRGAGWDGDGDGDESDGDDEGEGEEHRIDLKRLPDGVAWDAARGRYVFSDVHALFLGALAIAVASPPTAGAGARVDALRACIARMLANVDADELGEALAQKI